MFTLLSDAYDEDCFSTTIKIFINNALLITLYFNTVKSGNSLIVDVNDV